MYEINNKTFRNLEEQVQKNKKDIAKHYEIDRALSNLGIKIVGQVTLASQLPNPLIYQGDYGDAYAVGSKSAVDQGIATYEYYVFTRPDPNAGQPNNHWLNVGKISIVGPQGVQGIQGPAGPAGTSSQWYAILNPSDPKMNDMRLAQNGDVYQYLDAENFQGWVYFTNIKGPQGIQGLQGQRGEKGDRGEPGPQGERGDVGGFINIRGILTSTTQLPLPSTIDNLTVAYLIGASEPYDLYIQVGENSDVATWNNAGPFNAATLVTVNGEAQNVWDADTKLDKDTSISTYNKVYIKQPNGTQTTASATHLNAIGYMPYYSNAATSTVGAADNGGTFAVATPQQPYQPATKKYVDDGLIKKIDIPDGIPGNKCVVGYNQGSADVRTFTMGSYTSGSGHRGSIAIYGTNGCLASPTPINSTDVATKGYVDTAISTSSGGSKFFLHKFTANLPVEVGGAIMSGWFYSTKNTQILNSTFVIQNVEDIQSIVGNIRYFHN